VEEVVEQEYKGLLVNLLLELMEAVEVVVVVLIEVLQEELQQIRTLEIAGQQDLHFVYSLVLAKICLPEEEVVVEQEQMVFLQVLPQEIML
jgi:hypothetical protein